MKLIPELREAADKASENPETAEGAKRFNEALDELLARPEHAWYTGNMPAEEAAKRKAAQEEFKARYSK